MIINSCYDDEGVTRSDSDPKVETLIFGKYFDKCQGNACVEIFKLQDGVLEEDMSDVSPFKGYFFMGDFTEFKGSTVIKTEALLEFPSGLLDTRDTYNTIGQPNSADQGSIYLEYQNNDIHKQFIIDADTNNLPEYLREYIIKMKVIIGEIGEVNNDY